MFYFIRVNLLVQRHGPFFMSNVRSKRQRSSRLKATKVCDLESNFGQPYQSEADGDGKLP